MKEMAKEDVENMVPPFNTESRSNMDESDIELNDNFSHPVREKEECLTELEELFESSKGQATI